MPIPKLPDKDIVRESLADARNQVHNWRIGCSPDEARDAFERLMFRLDFLEENEVRRMEHVQHIIVLQRDR